MGWLHLLQSSDGRKKIEDSADRSINAILSQRVSIS
jgi:hypothetical protein